MLFFSVPVGIHVAKYNRQTFCGCECWTLTGDLERRIKTFGNNCYMRMLGISYGERKTNEYVWQQVDVLAGR